jgi:hypothetical protein
MSDNANADQATPDATPTEATSEAPPRPAAATPAERTPLPTAQTRPLWIAILALAAVLLFIIAFTLGRVSDHHGDGNFGPRIVHHPQMGPGQGWGQ